jgi:exopolysaccharide biosynthesis predicted pyruvyltransferase EpsI
MTILWRAAKEVRIPSFHTILRHNYQLVAMPQSIFYLGQALKQANSVAFKEKVALGLGLAKEQEQEQDYGYTQ